VTQPLPHSDELTRLQARLAQRYRFERELGRGRMSISYVARDLIHSRPITIRLIPPQAARALDPERFLRSLRAAALVEHPHVLPLLDSGEVDLGDGGPAIYYTLPWVAGESLRERLDREGQLPIAESLRIAADIAGALAAAHARGIVHGDVRPENILLSGGSSVAVLSGLGAGELMADGRYRSPEQSGGAPPYPRSDVYALGVVLYEMLAGEPPGNPVVPLRAGRRPVAEDVELIVAQAIATEPADRFESAAGLASALGAAAVEAGRPVFTTAERLAPRARLTPRWVFFGSSVLVLLVVSLWLRWTAPATADPTAPPPPPNSVAVLPLVNASPDTAGDYLGDGLTGELITALETVPGLRVAGQSSSFGFKGTQLDAQQVGRRLGVGAVLEGSVRQAGGRLRVTTHLVSVAQGFDLWSETYEGDESSIFSVRDEIARAVTRTLRLRLPVGAAPATAPLTSLHTYQAYLAGRALLARESDEDLPGAIVDFELATSLDSAYAPAWTALAETRATELVRGLRPTKDAAELARAAATRALTLDSADARARTMLALVLFARDWKWSQAEREFKRAIELDPDLPDPHHWYSHLLTALGRRDESLNESRRALELSPSDPKLIGHLGWHYLMAGAYEPAETSLARVVAFRPGDADAHYLLARLAEARGDYVQADEHLARVPAHASARPWIQAEIGRVHALAGRTDEAKRILEELRQTAMSGFVPSYELAVLWLALGDTGRALALLDEAAADRDAALPYLRADPRLERLRGDRRFARVVRRLGLP
jgi:TolB-like protein/Flp pilus assembly protein TadD